MARDTPTNITILGRRNRKPHLRAGRGTLSSVLISTYSSKINGFCSCFGRSSPYNRGMEILNCAYCGTVYALEHLGHTIFADPTDGQGDMICLACSDAQKDIKDEMLAEEHYSEMTDMEADADTLASAGMGTDEDYGYYGEYGPFGDY